MSECGYKYEDSCTLYDHKCIYITDCHYKQLQQLKATLDEIEKQIKLSCDICEKGSICEECSKNTILEKIKEVKE